MFALTKYCGELCKSIQTSVTFSYFIKLYETSMCFIGNLGDKPIQSSTKGIPDLAFNIFFTNKSLKSI